MGYGWFICRGPGNTMGKLFPDSGPREGESREDYLARLKRDIVSGDYVSRALEEIANSLTKGLEKGFINPDASPTQKDDQDLP